MTDRALGVPSAPTLTKPSPILLCMDLQNEHVTQGRHHWMHDAEVALDACRNIILDWRAKQLPIVHLKRVAKSAWFNPATTLTDWISEFRPRPGELSFEHPLPSAFSSSRFATFMAEIARRTTIVIIGFSLEEAILATVVDGFHRGHTFHVVENGVACAQTELCTQPAYKNILIRLSANYATVGGTAVGENAAVDPSQ